MQRIIRKDILSLNGMCSNTECLDLMFCMSIASSKRMLCQQAPWSRLNFRESVGPSVS